MLWVRAVLDIKIKQRASLKAVPTWHTEKVAALKWEVNTSAWVQTLDVGISHPPAYVSQYSQCWCWQHWLSTIFAVCFFFSLYIILKLSHITKQPVLLLFLFIYSFVFSFPSLMGKTTQQLLIFPKCSILSISHELGMNLLD